MTTPHDDDRTVIGGAPGRGGAPSLSARADFSDALPVGTRLHEFEILSVIGQGGFGIVYLARDLTLERRVALKEYMPSALAARTAALTVAVRSNRHADTFAAGLRSFVNEARLLAQFDHPSLLKVHRFWEAHGTAYMVMPYIEGITFGQMLAQSGAPPDEAKLRALLDPLLSALEQMHAAHCYHRDIAPDNILMLRDGRPMLLDFGAARRVIGDMTQALTVILKTGFAPVEQYGELPDMSQGAWTDLYALGSVIEFAITGHTPPQAVTRFLADMRQPLARTAAGRYGERFLQAIDRALAVLPKDRPQSVAEMRALLALPAGAGAAPSKPAGWDNDSTVLKPAPAPIAATARRPKRREVATGVVIALALAGAAAWFVATRGREESAAAARRGAAPPEAASHAVPPAAEPASSGARSEPMPASAASASAIAEPPWPSPSPVPPAAAPVSEPAPPPESVEPPAATQSPTRSRAAPSPAPDGPGAPLAAPLRRATSPARAERPTPAPAQPIPKKNLSSERCADIIQRVSLGEALSEAEKSFLKQECGR